MLPSVPTVPTLARRGGGVAGIVVPPTSAYDDVIDADSPAAHYKLSDEGSDFVMNARVGPNGTYSAANMTYQVTGLVANNSGDTAASFIRSGAGTGGFAQVAQAAAEAAFDGTGHFTHELWLTPLSDVARATSQNLLDRTFYGLYLTTDNKPAIFCGAGGANNYTAAAALLAGTTYHLVYTFDGTTHEVYSNGVSIISQADTATAGGPLGVGRYPDAGDTPNATLDEVAIYTAALSAARVAAHHTAGV